MVGTGHSSEALSSAHGSAVEGEGGARKGRKQSFIGLLQRVCEIRPGVAVVAGSVSASRRWLHCPARLRGGLGSVLGGGLGGGLNGKRGAELKRGLGGGLGGKRSAELNCRQGCEWPRILWNGWGRGRAAAGFVVRGQLLKLDPRVGLAVRASDGVSRPPRSSLLLDLGGGGGIGACRNEGEGLKATYLRFFMRRARLGNNIRSALKLARKGHRNCW